ncbi:MAG: hypothetical protein J6Y85_04620 [Alphaproteobacteria bacterium]|nr:hypothetical protein [Alphaproteobacteria bacterium]
MTTNNAMAAKAKKIAAYRDLMKMKDYFHLCYGETRQEELDKSLMDFATKGSLVSPLNINHVEIENRIVRLMIDAGANPNAERMGLFKPESLFEVFMEFGKVKPHCALEIAKVNGFKPPKDVDPIFGRLEYLLEQQITEGKPSRIVHPITMVDYDDDETKQDFEVRKKLCRYGQALVYTLFEKGIKPKDKKLLKSLQPVYEAEKKRLAQSSRPTSNTPTGGHSGASR